MDEFGRITRDNLPDGVWFDEEGGTWQAVKTTAGVDDTRDWWRWAPLNPTAMSKGSPDTALALYDTSADAD